MDKVKFESDLFLEIPYDKLEEMNIEAKKRYLDHEDKDSVREHYLKYLEWEKRIKAVTLCFCNIEWQLHMLDYDKKYFIKSYKNLTFDWSSVRGFTVLEQSDLRLSPDFYSFRWLPSDLFWPGKVLMFAYVKDLDGKSYNTDARGLLSEKLSEIYKKDSLQFNTATELEWFLVKWINAEQRFDERIWFELESEWWYFNALPDSELKKFIDKSAEAQRAMWFENEKDNPEVAPSQFELNYSYTDALLSCDQILLYKLVCRQVAYKMWLTATFLPKPISGINGSWMHLNLSFTKKWKNIFYDKDWESNLSTFALDFSKKILNHAPEICIFLNSSVNAYRRLDPAFEAPNQIKMSPTDRSSMIRVPAGNEKSARIEIRSVAPDSNPYLATYIVLKTWLEWEKLAIDEDKRIRTRFLPGTLIDAIKLCKTSDFITEIVGEELKEKYIDYKLMVADRSGKDLWKRVKNAEILYHHEITNQVLWNNF